MRTFDLQGIEIGAPRSRVFAFLSDPRNLPAWAHAIRSADAHGATLATAAGMVDVRLRTLSDAATGTVDWQFEFPDGTIALAHSRVSDTTRGTCIYSFLLHAPPVPLERVEGALDAQSVTLRSELATLKSLMENP
jgi:hypothetical protein